MTTQYTVLDPSGNLTILVTSAVERQHQPALAAALLAAEPDAEQVGFLEPPGDDCHIRVRMAGGEFCGNATLCAAALYSAQSGEHRALVGMSGADRPLTVTLQQGCGAYEGRLDMPLPTSVETRTFSLDGRAFSLPMVTLPGITHLLLTQPLAKRDAERAVKLWCRELQAPGLGLMMLEEATMTLTPLVYIPGGDTLYWERSCASGTAAVGAALATLRGESLSLRLSEPGGQLGVQAEMAGGRLARLVLEGRVVWDGKFKVCT